MTGVIDIVLGLVAGANPPAITPEDTNVLRFPATAPPSVRTDVLAHTEGGLTTDASLRPRMSVLLGPGATFQGVAQLVRPLYVTAAAGAGGKPAPTRDELAKAIVVYNRLFLPPSNWAEHRVGVRVPLPVEIEVAPGTAWIVNADNVRAWAAQFDNGWTGRLTTPPAMLTVPDPMTALPQQADALITQNPTAAALGTALRASVLRNPFASVLVLFEVLRRVTAITPTDVTLALLDGMVTHQAALLASTSAGNAVLRRLDSVLAAAPAGTDAQRLQRNRALLAAALFVAPGGARVAFRELPETPAQLKDRGPVVNAPGAATDPVGGVHRIVLGHDVAVGRVREETIEGVTYRGPAYAGRLLPAPFIAADAAKLPSDATSVARVAIVSGIAPNEGNLDAIRMRDAGILSSGIHQWSAHSLPELPALLFRFKNLAPEEYSLFFGMYGLDVIPDPNPAHVGQFILRRVDAAGAATNLDYAATRTFFDGAVVAGKVVFGTTWAARFRLASVASEAYRRCQILEAIGRFDRIKRDVGNITVSGSAVAVETLISSKQGVALLLDSHINKPKKVKGVLQAAAQAPNMPADADQRDRKITKTFHDTRNVFDRPTRNAGVDAAAFDVAHGTFTGW